MKSFQTRWTSAKTSQRAAAKNARIRNFFCLTLPRNGIDADLMLKKQHLESLKRLKKPTNTPAVAAEQPTERCVCRPWLGQLHHRSLSAARASCCVRGIHGDKKLACSNSKKQLKTTYLQPFAKILLALAARREKQNPLRRNLFSN